MNETFSSINEVRLKIINTNTVFNKSLINNEWSVNFFQISPRGIQPTYSIFYLLTIDPKRDTHNNYWLKAFCLNFKLTTKI